MKGLTQVRGNNSQEEATRPSRLYRDENNKLLVVFALVIVNYFGIDKLIVRILFVLGFGIIFYSIPDTVGCRTKALLQR